MDDSILNDIEVTPLSVVKISARDFALALSATPQFKAFEAAVETFENDVEAQKAYQEFQTKQQEIKLMLSLNTLSSKDRIEFERVRRIFQDHPSVISYVTAQKELISICQAAGDIISHVTELDFGTSASTSGCC